MFKEFTFIFLLVFFHELGHIIVGLFFNWKIIRITFYPYGGKTLFEHYENESINKEILVLLAGPLMQILTFLVLNHFFSYPYIRVYHLSILCFNLLPCLSLDGGRLLNLFLDKFFNYIMSFYITFVVSIITIILLILFCLFNYYNLNLFLISIFLVFKIIKSLEEVKFLYNKFLLERYLYDFKFKNRKVCKDIYKLSKNNLHYIKFQNERALLENYFKYYKNN